MLLPEPDSPTSATISPGWTLKSMPRTKPQQIKPQSASSIAWADVAGCDEAKAELSEVVEFLRDPKRFHALGAQVPKGIMLHGPPGTGKTLLAKAVAHESGAQFFSQSAASFVEMFAGLGAARATALLFTADFIAADDARASGFVLDVIEPDAFDAKLDALASTLASHAPITLQVTREAIRRIVGRVSSDGDDLVQRAYGSSDFREGVAAFIEKRAPRWGGR